MNRWIRYVIGMTVAWMMSMKLCAQVSEELFRNPPREARPSTYWEWMNGNINKVGLTKDLEYMRQAGYGGAMIFDAGVGIPRGEVDYNSPQWKDAVRHTAKEAERLGLELYMHNSPGYSGTGGPWIPVELSMKQLVWSEKTVLSDGRRKIEMDLPRPCSKQGFYRDAFVLAYPSLPEEKESFRSLVKKVSVNGESLDGSVFFDYDWQTQFRLEKGDSLLFELTKPFTLQAATIYRGTREKPLDPHDGPRDYAPSLSLEVSDDGIHFSKVGSFISYALRAMDAPSTLSVPLTSARYLRLTSDRGTNLSEIDFHASPRLNNYVPKINAASVAVGFEDERQKIQSDDCIQPASVINLTDRMDDEGHLSWEAPAGRWTLVRIGYTTTGEVVAAAPDAGIGLDCDKFSREAIDFHFDRFLDPLLTILKPWCGTTLKALVIDSWEAGKQNWTEELPTYFKEKRGYDLYPYLLAATGRIVGSVNETERFLWDFRRTHTDMFLANYVERFKERAGRHGLKYAGEAYGDGNFESLELAARQDYPMSEFWTHYIYGNITTTMLAASTAHVWGRPVVPCECYTGTPFNSKFTEHPYGMKALGDYILSAGVNRFVYHATTHQPYVGKQHGNMMTMGPFGTHFDRTSTWAKQFAAFNLYASRCAYLLQQGKYVADVLYLKDEAISSGVNNYNVAYPSTPYGYRWDIAGAEALQKRVSIDKGRIVLPDGMEYSLLVVTPMHRSSPETLSRLIELVKQGMNIWLPEQKPVGYTGLDSLKDAEVRKLADVLWGADTLGKGRIFRHISIGEALLRIGKQPDFSFVAKNKDAQIHFIHRKIGEDEVYFVSNHRRRLEALTLTFRVTGKTPKLWDAETGKTGIPVAYEENAGLTCLNLELPESGSIFIVFRKGKGSPSAIEEIVPESTLVQARSGKCNVFNPLSLESTFTVALWAKPETFAASGRGFLIYPPAGKGDKAWVGIAMGQNGIRVYERNQKNQEVLSYHAPIEGWTHIGLVYQEGTPTLYVNGKKVSVGKRSSYVCVPAIDVPMEEEQFIASFEGDQTYVQVFSYAMGEREIAALHNEGLPLPRMEGVMWKDLSEDWTVSFPAESKILGDIRLATLMSLHKHPDFNVCHFSGTATYKKRFVLTDDEINSLQSKRVQLNLGRVENMAEVTLNGKALGLVWKAPYSTDITNLLKTGENLLTIETTNLYPNRMIGDEHLPELYEYDEYGRLQKFPDWYKNGENNERERVLFLPWKYYKETDPLLESGLLGPVRIGIFDKD